MKILALVSNLKYVSFIFLFVQKPNANEYYKGMLERTTLPNDIKPILLKNKVRNLRKSYQKAVDWSNQTGQGVREEQGETSFKRENH
jgi:hypothetical protein